ncbi:hemolytic protein HlpA [Deltaproteobacteria bacterium]|nr:hemolytic protein HlpA [Deltaproteobacteria bacterium]
MSVPVLFLIFNRPETTGQVFAAIREARPERLYIAADGPRPRKEGEDALCARTRRIAQEVDWPCEVKTLFRKRNLGCALAVSSAVTWFFRQESEGVILEDDVLPHPDFFYFCAELLARYRNTPEVMLISGNNFQLGLQRGEASYYFSRFPHIWGWASWARAWKFFDLSMPGFGGFMRAPALWPTDIPEIKYHWQLLQAALDGRIDTWDCAWAYAIFRQNGLSALPNHNLARNIGFGGGTNCLGQSIWDYARTQPMPQLRHPVAIQADRAADDFSARVCWPPPAMQMEAIMREATRRLESGEARANEELLLMARKFYGNLYILAYLETLTTAALGNSSQAMELAEKLLRDWPREARADVLLPQVAGILRKNM